MPNEPKVRLTPPSSEPPKYEVGYRRPPAASQFTPGRSGNPKGRPKGARNKRPGPHEERLKEIVIDEAYRTIKVSEGKRQITVPMAKAVVRSLAVNAARGQLRSQQVFTKLLTETERSRKQLTDRMFEAALDYKIKWEQELERRKALGVNGPEPVPHPDDVQFDLRTSRVIFTGPLTKEHKVKWDHMRGLINEVDRVIEDLTEDLKRRRKKEYRQSIEDEIADFKQLRARLVDLVGEPKRRDKICLPRSTP